MADAQQLGFHSVTDPLTRLLRVSKIYIFFSLLHDFFLESILALTSYDTAKSLHAATVKHPWGFLCSGIKK